MPSNNVLYIKNIIKNNPRFKHAILEHYEIGAEMYKQQPFFYKWILRESRFNIVTSIYCFIFSNRIDSIGELKSICSKYRIASPNSVTSIMNTLRTAERIKTWRCSEDRRKTIITLTPKGVEEFKNYMSCALLPINTLFPNAKVSIKLLDDDIKLHDFFYRVADCITLGVTFKKLLPELELFIDKDGGRMIMLYLYLDAIRKINLRGSMIDFSPNALATEFSVSRIHVNHIIKSAQDHGYLERINDGQLIVNNTFIDLVEDYIALYFAYVTHYINVIPKNDDLLA